MSPGAPFEVIQRDIGGEQIRVFKNAPPDLASSLNAARRYGDAEFIVSGKRRISYAEFFTKADRLAAALGRDYNIQPGQSVAIAMKNEPEWMMAFVAIVLAGGVAVLINSRGTGAAMHQAVIDSETQLVIADERRREKLRDTGCELPFITPETWPTDKAEPVSVTRAPEDLVAMFFTSGTTGTAKAAAISHRNLVTGTMNTQLAMAAVFVKMARAYNIDVETLRSQMPQSSSLLVFPLFHSSGCSAVFLTSMLSGGKLVLMDRWSAAGALKLIETEKVTTFGGVPTMHWDVLHAENFDKYDLSSLMSISCGGQALPLNLLDAIRAKFPRAFIGAGYGMTETSGAIAQANGEAFLAKPRASGQILPMMDVQISSEDGEPLSIGSVGEIWVKGATLMQGYYGRPEDTARSMSGPWFKTGDIGHLDEDGYIYIVDRKTDMVISGGENIYCAEVEQVLGRHPDLISVVAFGVPDDRLGERLVVSAQSNNPELTSDVVIEFAQIHLGQYKVPTDIALQKEPFRLNAMGKVEKHSVRSAYLTRMIEQAS